MPQEGIRRSSRISKQIDILLVGSDMEGKVFSENTKTVLLSRYGAGIVSKHKLSPEQELILRRLDTNRETDVRVVGQIGAESGIHTYGVAFLDSTNNFWGIKFPSPTEGEKQASAVLLECSSCKERESVEQSDVELDVYLVNQGIVRYCKQCGSSTFWKRAIEVTEKAPVLVEVARTESHTSVAVEEAPELVPVAEERPAPRAKNRRKDVRTKATFKACVRSFVHGDDVVTCENVSRGGLRFKTCKSYPEKFKVEIAAPYTEGVPNFFVPAEIVRVEELEEEKMFRCGVAYLKGSRQR